jgi:transposase InsO family protein
VKWKKIFEKSNWQMAISRSVEHVALLEKHGMVVTMSGPGNPYDNPRCERFMLTLNG